ncbi:MAG: phosphoribosylglycinamide formyltransferase [Prolixibacteraceae bacterium]|jgi:phosphoribosylglycinamide formyltransferase-1|nr:phosphoribosylglycinamide formyltransferase [Prolixibacteraceae bacterium]
MKKIAIFASGSGSNAENIVRYFKDSEHLNIECIYSNKPDAFVLKRAKKFNIPTMVFNRDDFYKTDVVLNDLKKRHIDYIVLAGFLWLVPANLTENFTIINIHPALLPKYGGKGMYGDKVHKAVIENNEKKSGITIHYVNDKYDDGQIIFQAECDISSDDTPETVAQKVHGLEYEHFPGVIEKLILNN